MVCINVTGDYESWPEQMVWFVYFTRLFFPPLLGTCSDLFSRVEIVLLPDLKLFILGNRPHAVSWELPVKQSLTRRSCVFNTVLPVCEDYSAFWVNRFVCAVCRLDIFAFLMYFLFLSQGLTAQPLIRFTGNQGVSVQLYFSFGISFKCALCLLQYVM